MSEFICVHGKKVSECDFCRSRIASKPSMTDVPKFTQADMDEHASKVLKAAADICLKQADYILATSVEEDYEAAAYALRAIAPDILSLTPASIEMADAKKPYKGPIDRPCSACSAGDTAMEYHNHERRK